MCKNWIKSYLPLSIASNEGGGRDRHTCPNPKVAILSFCLLSLSRCLQNKSTRRVGEPGYPFIFIMSPRFPFLKVWCTNVNILVDKRQTKKKGGGRKLFT